MAYMPNGFNAQEVAPTVKIDPIPKGEYTMQIIESDINPTKAGGAQHVFKFQVLDGQYAGRTVMLRLNTDCPSSEVAQNIAYSQLSGICHATGIINCTDTEQLHGIPMLCHVTVKPAKDGYDPSNDIKTFESANGQAPAQQPPMQQPVQQTYQQPNTQPMQQQPMQQPQQNFQQPAQGQPQQQPTQQPAQQQQPWQNQQPAQQPVQGQPGPAATGGQPPWMDAQK